MCESKTQFRLIGQLVYGDLVKDSATAIAITEALLQQNFGEKILLAERPLAATERKDQWVVTGNTNERDDPHSGPIVVQLNKCDAQVMTLFFAARGVPALSDRPPEL